MSARDSILITIRDSLGPRPDPAAIAAKAAALLKDSQETRPRLAAPVLADAFALKATVLGTTIDHLHSRADIPPPFWRRCARSWGHAIG